MPYLSNLLRPSSGNIANIKRVSIRSSRSSSPDNSTSVSPYASDSDDASLSSWSAPKTSEPSEKRSRLMLPFGRSSKNDNGSRVSLAAAAIDWALESPPVVFYGTPEDSTGALISGLMIINVNEEFVDVESFNGTLTRRVTQKKPFQNHCSPCQTQVTELKTWEFTSQTTTLHRGVNQFPFSMLLGGENPASITSSLVTISYHFTAEAVVTRPAPNSSRLPLKFERVIDVKRSLPEPMYPHRSVRVFPPTNIKASAEYTSVIHPTSSNQFSLKLDGLVTHYENNQTVDMWKLKKVRWKLEETVKTAAPACDKHLPQPTPADQTPKTSVVHSETRVLGEKYLLEGWKSDFSSTDGVVNFEFDYGVLVNNGKFACDVRTEGSEVSHVLALELIVSKESAPNGKPQQSVPTGTGRILRMHFSVNLTEYPGNGVSWDNESPPVYQDVPPSPPEYPMEPPIEYNMLEELDAMRQSGETSRSSASELSM